MVLVSVIANLVMEYAERRALELPLKYWKCNFLSLIPCGKLIPLLQHINPLEPSINLTYELEDKNYCLPFLDVLLEHCEDGSVSTSLYHKPTLTDCYLILPSIIHLCAKRLVLRYCSQYIAIVLPSSNIYVKQEHVYTYLQSNNYLPSFVERVSQRKLSRSVAERQDCKSVVVPYIRGLSEALKQFLSSNCVLASFYPRSDVGT